MKSTAIHDLAVLTSLHDQGWSVVPGLLGASEVGRLADELDRLAAATDDPDVQRLGPDHDGTAPVRKIRDVALRSEAFADLMARPDVVGLATHALACDEVRLLQSTAWMKPAGVGPAKPPHQDAAHWLHLTPLDFVTVWVAIDDATVDNGCLWFSPTAPHRPLYRHVRRFDHAPSGDLVIEGWDVTTGTPAEVRAGDASLHGGRTVHWSQPNRSEQQRRGVSLSFCRASAESRAGLDLGGLPVLGRPTAGA